MKIIIAFVLFATIVALASGVETGHQANIGNIRLPASRVAESDERSDALSSLSRQSRQAKTRHLPPGPVHEKCCRTFCFPIEIGCICCFLDYDYFNGQETVHVNGVPEHLKSG
uniref:Hepcidin n=1 Tax=Plectus sambesii TaxID=2011161 RepID=A0A914WMT0_9BILA